MVHDHLLAECDDAVPAGEAAAIRHIPAPHIQALRRSVRAAAGCPAAALSVPAAAGARVGVALVHATGAACACRAAP